MISGKRLSSLEGLTKYKMRDWISMHCRFWENQRSTVFDVKVCHPIAESYKDFEPQQLYAREREEKRLYSRRVLDIEHGTFRPLVFTTTDGMGRECLRYHSRLAEMIAIKKTEQHANTMSWIRSKILFCIIKMSIQLF